ncbi:hypothetical protein BDZ91DRAFT_701109 [Kalaharituber pfeilii]|nr:hypothetical protein BDZ91DRAFT_701109 [Kalaharituber pfeilii]
MSGRDTAEGTLPPGELKRIERELDSQKSKRGAGGGVPNPLHKNRIVSDSTLESGIDKMTESEFPGSHVTYGSVSTGRVIPAQEGGDQVGGKGGGRPTVDKDFEGEGGPEDKLHAAIRDTSGDDDIAPKVFR